MTRRPFRLRGLARESGDNPLRVVRGHEARGGPPSTNDWVAVFAGGALPGNTHEVHAIGAPFGDTGDLLWIRERARVLEWATGGLGRMVRLAYDLDGSASPWLPYPSRLKEPVVGRCIANGVFREGARHLLEVVEVRAELVAEISEQDACLEGLQRIRLPLAGADGATAYALDWPSPLARDTARDAFFAIYDSIYGAGAHSRDWCWVYTLKRAEALTGGRNGD